MKCFSRKASLYTLPAALAVLGVASVASIQPVSAQSTTARQPEGFSQGILFPYSILDRALDGRIDKNGYVDYVALKGDKNLTLFLQAVATADLSRFPVLKIAPLPDPTTGKVPDKMIENRDAELVFWINAYNAHMLNTLANAYPIDSPDEIKNLDTDKTHTVAGEQWSFRDMRKKIASFEPRALFALTNGTKGGPPLAPVAYRFAGLNEVLNMQVRNFVNDKRNVEVIRLQNKVTVSKQFLEFNQAFAPETDAKKMVGVKTLLQSFTDQRGERSYYTTNTYQIITKESDRTLNRRESNSATGGTS